MPNQNNSLIKQITLYCILSFTFIFNAGFDNYIVYYLLALGLGGIVLLDKDSLEYDLTKSNPILCFSAFVLWSGISILWSINPTRTIIEFLQLVLILVTFLLSYTLDEDGKEKTIYVVALVSACIAFLGILEYIFIKTGRITSTFVNPNPFGTYLLILFLFYWGITLRANKKILIIVSIIFIVALLLTGSRGTYLSIIISTPILFLGVDKSLMKKYIAKTFILMFTGIGITRLLMYISPIIQKNLGLDLNIINNLLRASTLFGSSSVGRFEFWKSAFRIFIKKPITGFGLGTFFQSYFIGYGGNQWYSRFAHNHYLQILAELGIVGLFLFSAFILATLWTFWKVFKTKEYPPYFIGIVAAFIGFLAHIFIEFSWNFPGVTLTMFWMLGISVSLHKSDIVGLQIKPIFIKVVSIVLLMVTLWHFGSTKLLSVAVNYQNEGNIEKARNGYSFANKIYPINNVGLILEGDLYYISYEITNNTNYLKNAIDLGEKAVKLVPFDGETHTTLGKYYQASMMTSKAEKHYILGAEYSTYGISRYKELAEFYISDNRLIDAENTLIKSLDNKESLYIADPSKDKQSSIYDISSIHVLLFEIYKRQDKPEKMKEQADLIMEMAKEHEFLNDWYKMEKFQVN